MFEKLIPLGIILILVGMVIVIVGGIGMAMEEKGEVKGGGVVLIGPIPIIFGTDKRFALILAIVALIIMILWFWGMKK